MRCPGVSLKALFEFTNFGPHDVLAVVKHLLDARVDGRLEGLVLCFEVDEGDAHEAAVSA